MVENFVEGCHGVWRVPETYIPGFLECDKLVDMHACAEKRG